LDRARQRADSIQAAHRGNQWPPVSADHDKASTTTARRAPPRLRRSQISRTHARQTLARRGGTGVAANPADSRTLRDRVSHSIRASGWRVLRLLHARGRTGARGLSDCGPGLTNEAIHKKKPLRASTLSDGLGLSRAHQKDRVSIVLSPSEPPSPGMGGVELTREGAATARSLLERATQES